MGINNADEAGHHGPDGCQADGRKELQLPVQEQPMDDKMAHIGGLSDGQIKAWFFFGIGGGTSRTSNSTEPSTSTSPNAEEVVETVADQSK